MIFLFIELSLSLSEIKEKQLKMNTILFRNHFFLRSSDHSGLYCDPLWDPRPQVKNHWVASSENQLFLF